VVVQWRTTFSDSAEDAEEPHAVVKPRGDVKPRGAGGGGGGGGCGLGGDTRASGHTPPPSLLILAGGSHRRLVMPLARKQRAENNYATLVHKYHVKQLILFTSYSCMP
jgi:hypothetical protein